MADKRKISEMSRGDRAKRRLFGKKEEDKDGDKKVPLTPSRFMPPAPFPKTPKSTQEFHRFFESRKRLDDDQMCRYLEYQDWRAEQRQDIFGDCDNRELVLDDNRAEDPDYEPPLEIRKSSDSDPAELVSDDDREEEFSGFEGDDDDDQGKKKGESVEERDTAGVSVGVSDAGGSAGVGEGGSEVRGRRSPKDRKGKVKGKKSAPSEPRPVGENDGEGEVNVGEGEVSTTVGRSESGVGGRRRGTVRGRGRASAPHASEEEEEEEEEEAVFSDESTSDSDFGGRGVVRSGRRRSRPRVLVRSRHAYRHARRLARRARRHPLSSGDEEGGEPDSEWGTDPTPPIEIPFTATPGLKVPTPTTPLGFLQLFLSVELLRFLQEETNDYATYVRDELRHTRSYQWHDCSLGDIARYLGMVIMMGIVSFPSLRLYWAQDFPMFPPTFAGCMTRDRFLAISRYFHTFNRRAIPKENRDRLIIVKPILEFVQKKCCEILVPDKNLSLDEGTLPFKGHLSIKVYNPQKPHKYGLKFFFLCDSVTGYVVDFKMYSGDYSSLRDTVYGLLQRFVGQGFHVFMDNYYNSTDLAKELYEDGIHVSGTIRMNRGVPRALAGLRSHCTLKKGESIFRRKGNVFVICWLGNRLVSMISTAHGPEEEDYLHKTKKKGQYTEEMLKRPTVIRHYTAYMGGVDLFDQMVNYYSFARRTQRWTKKVTMYLLQLAIQNSYAVYRTYTATRRKMTLLQYLTMAANALIHFEEDQWVSSGTPLTHATSLPPSERLDRLPPTPRGLGRTPPSASARPTATDSEGEESVDDPDLPPEAHPAAAAPSRRRQRPSASSDETPRTSTAPGPAPEPAPGPSTDEPQRYILLQDPECRLDQTDHVIVKCIDVGKARQKRCRVCSMSGTRKDTSYMCQKCRVPVCKAPCFGRYHTKLVYWSKPPRRSTVGKRARVVRH